MRFVANAVYVCYIYTQIARIYTTIAHTYVHKRFKARISYIHARSRAQHTNDIDDDDDDDYYYN